MSKLRLGIIGVGNIGSQHFTSIVVKGKCPEIEVAAIADRRPARIEWARKAYEEGKANGYTGEFPAVFAEGDELVKCGIIDAVMICVPHYDHPHFAIEGFKNGLHVLCEKPAGVYTLQVREMIEEADKHPELKFGMMFNQRMNPVYKKMHDIVASGELGEIRRTNWLITEWYRPQFYYDSGDWRATWSGEGGGVLLNQCPHQLDLWQWICGLPIKVHAKMKYGKWHDIEVEDDVSVFCEYENGATGTFITSTGDCPGSNRFEIVCDGGTLVCDKTSLTIARLTPWESEYSRTNKTKVFGKPEVVREDITPDEPNTAHAGVLNAFANAILHGGELTADGREGIRGLMLSNAMHLSDWLGREVELPIDEQLFYELLKEKIATSRGKKASESVDGDTEGTY